MARASRQDILVFFAASLLLTAVFFYDVVFSDSIFADRDMLGVYLPLFQFWKERVFEGAWPEWYPFDGLGQSFSGNLFGLPFHPSKVLLFLFSAGTALKWTVLLSFPVAFMGFALLARQLRLERQTALLGAVLFAFNGFAVSMTNNLSYLLGMASVPWAFWLTLKLAHCQTIGRIFLAAVGYAMILLAGDSQSFILACAVGAVIPFVTDIDADAKKCEGTLKKNRHVKVFGCYCLTMLLTAGLTAVQWVPSLSMMSQASVGAVGHDAKAVIWSLPPLRLPELIFGGLNGTSFLAEKAYAQDIYAYEFGDFWGRSILIGLPAVVLALIGALKKNKLRIFLAASSIFLLLCILGKYVGLYELLHHLPLLTPFRYPEKLLSFWMLTVSLLAAGGFQDVTTAEAHSRRSLIIFGGGTALALLFVVGEQLIGIWSDKIAYAAALTSLRPEALADVHSWTLTCQWILAAGMLVSAAVLILFKRMFPAVLSVAAIIFLFVGTRGIYHPSIPEIAAQPILPVERVLELSELAQPRVGRASDRLTLDILLAHPELENDIRRLNSIFLLGGMYPGLFGIDAVGAYLPGTSDRMRGLLEKANEHRAYLRLANLFSAEFTSIWGRDYAEAEGTLERIVYEHPDFGALVVRNDWPMPKAYLAEPLCVQDEEESQKAVLSGNVNFRRFAILEGCEKSLSRLERTSDLGGADLVFRAPEHVAIDVDAKTDGSILVLTDAYYAGWTATIDGSPAEILPANHAVRGVMMPKGKHRVEFRYRTPGLIPASLLSLGILILGVLISFIFDYRRTRNDPDVLSVQRGEA